MFRKILTSSLAAVVITSAAVVASAAPASAADQPVWCGDWLQDPNKASGIKPVPNTGMSVPGTSNTSIQVNEGQYGGRWFAWAKVYNPEQTGQVALIWRYKGNQGLYQCGSRDGSTGWSWDYTAGVRDTQASLVQAKYSRNGAFGPVYYAAAVAWR
ncbi:hypothetical protein AB0C02_33025 [Micromonospora sp. NPDC048999]|uniref:hypothetical protein n=1 Tax=Micromonospora sp. NPDC048999 TaxID=3155391 RepID=UPI003411E10C